MEHRPQNPVNPRSARHSQYCEQNHGPYMPPLMNAGRLLGVWLLLSAPAVQADLVWHWEGGFSPAEREKLQTWLRRTAEAVEARVAPYPFDVHIFFYRRMNSAEPVPWAETRRPQMRGVDFYVDTSYPLEAFLKDWTAPHELSHLLIPFLDRRHAWFAEGFASYMQYQVMHEMGTLSAEEMREHYRTQIEKAAGNYGMEQTPFAKAATTLRRRREYPTLYWGGAAYFLRVDHALRRRDNSLNRVLTGFIGCCRTHTHDLPELIERLDRLSDSDIFTRTLAEMNNRPGFPRYADLFRPAD